MTTAMTESEQAQLAKQEAVVEQGMSTFVAVGTALLIIRDSRLYRASADSFEAYLQVRWGFTRRRANQLIEAAQTVNAISEQEVGTMVPNSYPSSRLSEQSEPPILPENERQVRPLASIEGMEERKEAWEEAVKTAPKGKDGKPKVTEKHVEKVVATRKAQSQPAPEPTPEPDTSGMPPRVAEAPPPPVDPADPQHWDSPAETWQQMAARVDVVVAEVRGLTSLMRKAFNIKGQEINDALARRYSFMGTVGHLNELVRYLEQNKPAGVDADGVVTVSDVQKRQGRKSA